MIYGHSNEIPCYYFHDVKSNDIIDNRACFSKQFPVGQPTAFFEKFEIDFRKIFYSTETTCSYLIVKLYFFEGNC